MSEPLCPYCLETVNQNALKCRHCGSSLAKEKEAAAADANVVYVLDKGLIRFGKFALTLLGMFVIFGIYIFGYDVKELVQEMQDTKKQMAEQKQGLTQVETEMKAAKAQMNAELDAARLALKSTQEQAEDQIQQSVEKAEAHALKVEGLFERAGLVFNEMETMRDAMLTPEQQERAEQAREELIADADADPARGKQLWPTGHTIKIHFMDGTEDQHKAVEGIASEWGRYGNFKFDFNATRDQSEVRITFKDKGNSWSFVGTDSLGIPKSEPTMNLGVVEKPWVLHEFGHALGLAHEHQNPKADLEWDINAMRSELNLDNQSIMFNYIDKLSEAAYPGDREFDRKSIMNNPIPATWLTSGEPITQPQDLSESDKRYIAQLYPKAP